MRLDKFVATYTTKSRKEAKKCIHSGKVMVEGRVVKDETKQVELSQNICMDGEPVVAKEHIYLMLNKPQGVLSATKDAREQTVIDLIPDMGRDLFPVGRLDKDTEGFLLLTDHGELAHRLLSPGYHVSKTYYVEYTGILDSNSVERVKNGLDIGEKRPTQSGALRLLSQGKVELTIAEGKFHQVKRMIAALGGKVTYLKRISMAGIPLDENLAAGEWRELTPGEVDVLLEQTKVKRKG